MAAVTQTTGPVYSTYRRQVRVAPTQHLAFAAGHGYYAGQGAPAQRPLPNGQRQASDASYVNQDPYASIIASLPQPLTQQQIIAQAHNEISPLVAAITGQIGQQTAAATHAIAGYGADAAAKLAALNFGAPYTQGEQGQAAVDEALRQSLAGAGSQDAAQLAQRLAVINEPGATNPAVDAVAGNGSANGNVQLAQGSAALGNLIANAAAANDFGQKQPGIARLAALQQITAAQQKGEGDLASQTTSLESQIPSLISGLQSTSDSRASTIAAARQNQLARQDAFNSAAAKNQTSVTVAQTRAHAQEVIAQEKANEKAAQDSKPNASLSRTYGYVVDTNGHWVPGADGKPQLLPGYTVNAQGAVVKAAKTASTTVKAPTANEINSWVDAWKNGKPATVTVKLPKPDANGNPVYRQVKQTTGKLTFDQAYQRLTAAGVPDPQARQYLRTAYKRGEQGRSWLTNEEQSTLAQAKMQPRAHVNSGVAYLDRQQATVLKTAGKLPPGHWIQGQTDTQDLGPVYVIDQGYD